MGLVLACEHKDGGLTPKSTNTVLVDPSHFDWSPVGKLPNPVRRARPLRGQIDLLVGKSDRDWHDFSEGADPFRLEEDRRLRAEREERLRRELEEERRQEVQRQRAAEAETLRRCREERELYERNLQEERYRHKLADQVARKQQAQAALEEQRRKEREEMDKVTRFLKANGFRSATAPKRRMMRRSYPLHCAVQQNNAEMVALLLKAGADLRQTDSLGLTALELAYKLDNCGSHSATIVPLKSPTCQADCTE